MGVADDAVNPVPLMLPSRIVVTVSGLVCAVGRALIYLVFAIAWVLSAILAATVVSHLAWGEGSAPFVFLMALMEAAVKVCGCGTFVLIVLAAVLLCGRLLVSLFVDPVLSSRR